MPKKRPHIIIFNPDQWRGDSLGHMGHPAAVTPNLDRMVETDGVSFRNAFCQNTVCTPSRCSFMSGWYPHVRGHRTMYYMMRPDEPVLLKTLKDNGYFVWWGGKNDLVPGQNGYDAYCSVKYKAPKKAKPNSHGVKEWRGDPGDDNFYSFYRGKLPHEIPDEIYEDGDWLNVLGAIDQIKEWGAKDTDQPLCIFLPLEYPHPPYAAEEPYYSMIDRDKVPDPLPVPENEELEPSILRGIRKNQKLQGWTRERWIELRATYMAMCARLDRQFGMVLDALREAGMYDDSAIFLFSDHGDFTGDYGLVEKTQNTFEDCLARVPFVVKPPADVPVKARVSDAIVELIDFPATVEALTGIEPKHTHFGRSLLPVLSGETDEHRDAAFCEGGRLHGEIRAMEIESEQKEGDLYWPRTALQRAEGPEHTKATMCRTARYKYVRRVYDPDELYDLEDDPGELRNRIHDPDMAHILVGMKERMLTFYQETCDVVAPDTDRRR